MGETYTLTQINPPSSAVSSSVVSINNSGQAVGNTSVKVGRSTVAGAPFVWSNGVPQSLPLPVSASSAHANAISDSGMVVGYANGVGAIWWRPAAGGGYESGNWNDQLPAGSPLSLMETRTISSDGQFVVFDAENTQTGLLGVAIARVETGELTIWTIPTGGNPPVPLYDSLANDIQSDGTTLRVVGWYARSATDHTQGFLWQRDLASGAVTMFDIDSTHPSIPAAVNNSSEVAVNIDATNTGTYRAFYWNSLGVKQQLGTLGGARTFLNSINQSGYTTGWSDRSGKNATAHAFLWSVGTGIRDLNTLKAASDTSGVELTSGVKINNVGQILARGVKKNSGVTVLLTPVL